LRFGDETGFSMTPNIPYGWLPVGKQSSIPSDNQRLVNIFSLMNLQQQLSSYPTKETINADFIIRCLDDFCATLVKTTVVVLDNAPWHTAQALKNKTEEWESKGLYLFYLPPYSPQLNYIEILWRKMKYEWLKPSDYTSKEILINAIIHILKKFGSEFQINFQRTQYC
jgi:transposase